MESTFGKPSKIKVFLFDDQYRAKETKSVNLAGLEVIMTVESSPALRASQGQKTDWSESPGDGQMALKVISYDKEMSRTVKQTKIEGLNAVVLGEPMAGAKFL